MLIWADGVTLCPGCSSLFDKVVAKSFETLYMKIEFEKQNSKRGNEEGLIFSIRVNNESFRII